MGMLSKHIASMGLTTKEIVPTEYSRCNDANLSQHSISERKSTNQTKKFVKGEEKRAKYSRARKYEKILLPYVGGEMQQPLGQRIEWKRASQSREPRLETGDFGPFSMARTTSFKTCLIFSLNEHRTDALWLHSCLRFESCLLLNFLHFAMRAFWTTSKPWTSLTYNKISEVHNRQSIRIWFDFIAFGQLPMRLFNLQNLSMCLMFFSDYIQNANAALPDIQPYAPAIIFVDSQSLPLQVLQVTTEMIHSHCPFA